MNALMSSVDEIVGIEHQTAEIGNILVVDWSLGNTCNYKCTYCPSETHSGSHPFMDIEQVLAFSKRINQHYKENLGREICFLYTGGEVTIFKDFIPLIKAQSEAGNKIGISTNGSRAVSYWQEARKYLDYVSISYHSDHTKLNHFIRVINAIKNDVQTHVNIMVKPEYFDQCIEAAHRVHEETSEVTIDVQIVLENFQRPFSYTDEQREKIMSVSKEINSNLNNFNNNVFLYKDERFKFYKLLKLDKMKNKLKLITESIDMKNANGFAYDWIYNYLYIINKSNIFTSNLEKPDVFYFIYENTTEIQNNFYIFKSYRSIHYME